MPAVRSMSPEETSKWCSSLALCGVRGIVLRDLQDHIIKKNIDGLMFDSMLRSNQLMDLGIEELNPRLALAIRRSWTTDFAAVSFVEYHEGQNQAPLRRGSGQDSVDMPMQRGQSPMQQSPMQQSQYNNRFSSSGSGPGSSPSMGHRGWGIPGPSQSDVGFPGHGMTPDSMGGDARDQFGSRGGARGGPRGPDEMPPHRGGVRSPDDMLGRRGGPRGQDEMPPHRGAEEMPPHRGGPRSPDEMLARRGGPRVPDEMPPHRGGPRGPDEMPPHRGGPRSPGPDDMPPQMAWTGAASPSPMSNGYPRSHGDWAPSPGEWSHGERIQGGEYRDEYDGGYPDHGGDYRHDHDSGYPDNRMGPPLAPSSPMPHGMLGRRGGHGGHEQPHHMASQPMHHSMQRGGNMSNSGLGMGPGMGGRWDGSPSPSGPPSSLGYKESEPPIQDPRMRQRPPGRQGPGQGGAPPGGWDGGLEEAFVSKRGQAPRSYASEDAARYEPLRSPGGRGSQPSMDQWGGGLDDVMPARAKMPANIAQKYAEEERERREAEAREAAERERREAAEDERRHRAAVEADPDWGGMSLGDTLALKRHERGGGGGSRRPPMQDDIDVQLPRGGGRPPQAGGFDDERRPPQAGGFDDEPLQDYVVQKPQRRAQPEERGGPSRSPGPPSRPPVMEMDMRDDRPPPRPARARQAAAPADNGWGGQSLADAFAPKKAPPVPPGGSGGGSSGSRGGGAARGGGSTSSAGDDCQKKPEEIIAWVRSLPESHVPEKSRENLAAIIEDGNLGGREFTDYVKRVPPEVCAPKNAMKLKAAWNNVLAETAAREVARQNALSAPTQKATMIVV